MVPNMDKERLSQFSALSGIPEIYLEILQQAAIKNNVDLFFRKINPAARFLLLNFEVFPKPSYIPYKTDPIDGHLIISDKEIRELNQEIARIFIGKKNAPQIIGNFAYAKENSALPSLLTIIDVGGEKKVLTSDLDPLLIVHYLDRDRTMSSTYQSDYLDWSKYLSVKNYGKELIAGKIGGFGPAADHEILTDINAMTLEKKLTPIINHLTSATFLMDESIPENILYVSRSGKLCFLERPEDVANKIQEIARNEKTVFLLKSELYSEKKHGSYQDIHELTFPRQTMSMC
jgi:hypothetical protein